MKVNLILLFHFIGFVFSQPTNAYFIDFRANKQTLPATSPGRSIWNSYTTRTAGVSPMFVLHNTAGIGPSTDVYANS